MKAENNSAPNPLSETKIREQLARILAWEPFGRSRRQSALLSYLVEESLAGRGERIKATSIAMEVFGRDESFDQQRDAIVRVEAGRLRKRLGEYYEGPGRHDPVTIDVPRGTYQPQFKYSIESGGPHASPALPVAPSRPQRIDRFLLFVIVGVVLLTLSMTAWLLLRSFEVPAPEWAGKAPGATVQDTSKPFIMVVPPAVQPGDEAMARLAFGLAESLIAKLAKLEGLSVMAHGSMLEPALGSIGGDLTEIADRYGVTHVLRGSLERIDEQVVVNLRLVNTRDGSILWAERLSRPEGDVLATEESLALALASNLSVQIQPNERLRLGRTHTGNAEALVLYRQGIVMLMPPNDMVRVEAARDLFRFAQELDPEFAGGYAGESFSYSVTVLFLKASDPKGAIETALPLAEKAIAVDPGFAMGYAVRSFAKAMEGDIDSALVDASRAVEIQPGDAFVRFIYGMNQIVAGRPEYAIDALKESLRLDPLESRTPYLNVLAIAQYAAGLYPEALQTMQLNLDREGPRGPHMDVFLAATQAKLGKRDAAEEIFMAMRQSWPAFPYESWVARWITEPGQLQETLALLNSL